MSSKNFENRERKGAGMVGKLASSTMITKSASACTGLGCVLVPIATLQKTFESAVFRKFWLKRSYSESLMRSVLTSTLQPADSIERVISEIVSAAWRSV